MFMTAVKSCNWRRKIVIFASGIGSAIALWGCSANFFQPSDINWKTYTNSRYGFQFPYPSNWTTLASPENQDGVELVSPQNKSVKIRSWASKSLLESHTSETQNGEQIKPNFQTVQGISGVLVVEVEQNINVMKLTINQGKVKYYWQGQSNSQEFASNYRMFYYIAQAYKIRQ
ncbi:MAG TPA: hypothetical protein VK203_27410 [Nostocaceae cyanobacterium]|nr:hypothetical protein [Nostocaceae cyanobacterium]